MEEINQIEDLDNIVAKNYSVIALFYAEWCRVGISFKGILEKLEVAYPYTVFVCVEIDKSKRLAEQYKIEKYPYTVIFVEGKEVNRFSGVRTESLMIDIIKNHIVKEKRSVDDEEDKM